MSRRPSYLAGNGLSLLRFRGWEQYLFEVEDPMKFNMIAGGFVAALAICWMAGASVAEDEKPKMTIKEAMKLHKDKLNTKFAEGKASKEEKEKLIEAYEAMGKNKPPKGDEKEWKEKCEALVKAVKADDKEAFGKAVNCKSCHDAHKK